MTTTATLQNNVRLRVFLIITLSIIIQLVKTSASDSVKKATTLLEINYILYGTILLCSLLPLRTAWMAALFLATCSVFIGGAVTILATVSTYRCINTKQPGCIQTSPWSVLSLMLSFIVLLLDILQCWTIYLILNYPSFVSSATQRIRILFSWALPFGWFLNIILFAESAWTPMASIHLMIDPSIIVLANTKETILLGLLIFVAMVTDGISLLIANINIVRTIIIIQLVLSGCAALLVFIPEKTIPDRGEDEELTMAEAVPASNIKTTLRHRQKSSTKTIKF